MRNIRRKLNALIERAYFYSYKQKTKDAIRENIKQSANQAYNYLTTESAHKKKIAFVSRFVITLLFLMLGVYLVFSSMTHNTQASTYSPQATVSGASTQITTPATTAPSNSTSSSSTGYAPGKGGNDTQASPQKAKAIPTCDPNTPMWDQLGNGGSETQCTYSGSGNGQTFTCTFDQLLLSQTDNSLGSNCTITEGSNSDQYYCYINDWSQTLSSQTLQCNPYGSTQKCQITASSSTCQLQNSSGQTECSVQPVANSLTGLPTPSSTVPLPQATVCPMAIPTCVVGTASTLPDWLTGTNGMLNSTSSTDINNAIGGIWQTMRDIALSLLVIPFFLAGYQIILSASSPRYAGAIQILTRVFIAGAAVAFSMTLIQMVVDVESAISQSITAGITWNPPAGSTPIIIPAAQWSCYAHQFFGGVFNISIYSMQNANGGSISTDQYVQLNYIDMQTIVTNLPFYIATLLSILLAIQLTVRFALICFQAILSPLVFMCGALPGDMGQMVIRPWVRGFVSLLLVQLLQLIVILAGYTLFGALTNTTLTGADSTGWITTLFQTLTPMIIIIVTLNIPRMMGSATTNVISTITSSFSSASTGILLIVRGI